MTAEVGDVVASDGPNWLLVVLGAIAAICTILGVIGGLWRWLRQPPNCGITATYDDGTKSIVFKHDDPHLYRKVTAKLITKMTDPDVMSGFINVDLVAPIGDLVRNSPKAFVIKSRGKSGFAHFEIRFRHPFSFAKPKPAPISCEITVPPPPATASAPSPMPRDSLFGRRGGLNL